MNVKKHISAAIFACALIITSSENALSLCIRPPGTLGSTRCCGAGDFALLTSTWCRCRGDFTTELKTSTGSSAGHLTYKDDKLGDLYAQITATGEWKKGDILLLGDSNVDIARLEYNPPLPRVFNAGISGATCVDIAAVIDLFASLSGTLEAPSKLVIMVGTNDLTPITGSADPVAITAPLWPAIDQFKLQYPSCEIIFRAILPGEPSPTSRIQYNQNVLSTNSWINFVTAVSGYTLVPDHDRYLLTGSTSVVDPKWFAMRRVDPLVDDKLHLGCYGQAAALENLSKFLYPALPINPGSGPNGTALNGGKKRPNIDTIGFTGNINICFRSPNWYNP